MESTREAYSKVRIVQFLIGFAAVALLCISSIVTNSTTSPAPLNNVMNLWIVIIGVAVGLPLLLWFDTAVKRIRVIFYVVMHILASMIVLFYVGTYDPMVSLWLILCILTYIEFGEIAFSLAAGALIGTTILFCLLLIPLVNADFGLGEYAFYSLSYATALIVTGYIITRIIDGANERQREMETARKAETIQLVRMNVLVNSIGDAILTLDKYGRVTSENAAALSFFDTNRTLIGLSVYQYLKLSDTKGQFVDVKKMIDTITKSEMRDDLVIKNEEQGTMRISLQAAPIYTDNKHEGVVMVLRDITRQKTLEDEKDEFISVASHELRTPIAVAEASLSNLMLMQEKGIDPSKLKSAAEMAHEEIIYLAGVVNDLSTLSRAERGIADKAEPVDMDELLRNLYRRYELDANKKGLKFNVDIKGKLPVIEASRLYVEEMLQNFLTNALKYTKEGSVTIAGEVVEKGVKCSVIDSGIGISKSDQKRLGERFFRSEDYRTRETNGTGLGLYVVKKLADKIGTKIEVESRLNHGSKFSITVPFESKIHTTGKRSSVDE